MLKRRLTTLSLIVLMLVALLSVVFMVPVPVLAQGATQIGGTAQFDEAGECADPEGAGADFALVMTGDLEGCHYVFIESDECSPSGTYRETGREVFVDGEGNGTFATTYLFTAKYEDCPNWVGQFFGRCQHPIVAGSGTGYFEGVTGRLDIKDNIVAGVAVNGTYRGHLRW